MSGDWSSTLQEILIKGLIGWEAGTLSIAMQAMTTPSFVAQWNLALASCSASTYRRSNLGCKLWVGL